MAKPCEIFKVLIALLVSVAVVQADDDEGDEMEMGFNPETSYSDADLWGKILLNATNGDVMKDVLSEKLFVQLFNDSVMKKLQGGKSILDPLLLWPIGPEVIKKTIFKGKFRACSLYLYNLKSMQLKHFEVQRNQNLTFQALRVQVAIPKLSIEGFYKLSDSKVLKILKTNAKGNFTVNVTNVFVDSIITLKTNLKLDNQPVMTNNTLTLDEINLDLKWEKIKFKFHGLRKGTRHITHWLMHKLVNSKLAKSKSNKVNSLVEEYIKTVCECLLYNASLGFEMCDLQFWLSKGFTYPANFFQCDD